jgi:hypothetical protein
MQTRADRLDVASVSKLVRAGLASVGFGVETGDPALARKVKHDPMINMARVFQITAALQAAGVDVSYNLMVGLPGQDWASVLQTAALLVDARPMRAVVDSLKLYPGSHYAETLPKEQRRDMTPEEIVSAENLLEFIIYYLCEARAHPDIGESYVGILAESVIDAIRIWTIYDLLIGEAGKEEQRERLLKMISRDGDAIFAARFAATRNSRLMTGFGVLGAGKDSPIICDEFRVAQETLRLRRDFKHTRLDPFLARIKFTDALPICYLPFSAIRWWMIIAMNLCEMAEERVGSGFKIENVRVVGGRVFAEKLRQALIDLTNAGIQTAFAGLDLDGLVAGREVDLLGFAVKVDPATKELVCSSGLS